MLQTDCWEMRSSGQLFRSKFTAHWSIPEVTTSTTAIENLLTSQTTYSRPVLIPICPAR